MKQLTLSFIFILLLLLLQGFSEASSPNFDAVDEGSDNNNSPVADETNTEAFLHKGHYCKKIRVCRRQCKKVGIKKYCHRSCKICCQGHCF